MLGEQNWSRNIGYRTMCDYIILLQLKDVLPVTNSVNISVLSENNLQN